MIALSKSEHELLREITITDKSCYKLFRPAKALVDHGLARWRGGTHDYGTLYATPEGRQFLETSP